MKKLAALILSVLILSLVGCNKTDNASSNISFADYTAESSAVTEDTNSESKIENTETVDSTKNNFSVSEKVPTKAETNNDSKLNGNINQNSDTNTNSKEKVSSAISNENESNKNIIKTLKLFEVTTYYGYTGYFTLSMSSNPKDIFLTELGIGDNSKALMCTSEYIDIDSGLAVRFIFEGDVIAGKDLMYNHVYPTGAAETPVKVTDDLATIKFYELTEYRGLKGYFCTEGINTWDNPHLALLGTNDYSKVGSIVTEYCDISNETDNIWFVYYNEFNIQVDTTINHNIFVHTIK